MEPYGQPRISTKIQDEAFFMYYYKIHACPNAQPHDTLGCSYSHPGDPCGRRNPAAHPYVSVVCPDTKGGNVCPRGDTCNYSHNMHEYWLHPSRFRTQMCRDGLACKRTVCFFAHTPAELRHPPKGPARWQSAPSSTTNGSSSSSTGSGHSASCGSNSSITSMAGFAASPGTAAAAGLQLGGAPAAYPSNQQRHMMAASAGLQLQHNGGGPVMYTVHPSMQQQQQRMPVQQQVGNGTWLSPAQAQPVVYAWPQQQQQQQPQVPAHMVAMSQHVVPHMMPGHMQQQQQQQQQQQVQQPSPMVLMSSQGVPFQHPQAQGMGAVLMATSMPSTLPGSAGLQQQQQVLVAHSTGPAVLQEVSSMGSWSMPSAGLQQQQQMLSAGMQQQQQQQMLPSTTAMAGLAMTGGGMTAAVTEGLMLAASLGSPVVDVGAGGGQLPLGGAGLEGSTVAMLQPGAAAADVATLPQGWVVPV